MRTLMILAIAMTPSFASAQTATTAPVNPPATTAAQGKITAPTGQTKPPGDALPQGRSRADTIEQKTQQADRKTQQSICKC